MVEMQMSSALKTPKNPLAQYILLAMVLGVVFGWLINQKIIIIDSSYISLISTLFLRAIKMIIAPLVFSTLVVGIAQMGSGRAIGRVGAKAMLWFMCASVISLFLGLILAHFFEPGRHAAGLILPNSSQVLAGQEKMVNLAQGVKDSGFVSFMSSQIIPTSIVDAASSNKLLQIVFFSVIFGVALAQLGTAGKPLIHVIDLLSQVMIKMTNFVMKAAPFAVFASMTTVVATQGLSILFTYGQFVGSFFLGLLVLWCILVIVGFFFLKMRVFTLLKEIKEAFFLSFATASSEAAYPKILEALDRFGVPRKISSFVMPLGYSFNLDGSMMYCTFACLFIAQIYGIDMPIGTQIAMLLTLLLTSKGMAGIPSASLVVIAGTLAQFGLPVEGMVLIMAVDRFLDMGRSATNAVGNSIATAVIGKWENHDTHS
jgi:Na+/H+-dicarboxylate symporter